MPRAARARRLPAAVAVRGLVPVARAHGRARRAHRRGRRRGVRGGRVSGPLDGSPTGCGRGGLLAATARADADVPAPTRRRRPPLARRVAAIREGYLLHYGDRARACAPTTPTSRCSPATASTRSASPAGRARRPRGDRRAGRRDRPLRAAHAEGEPGAGIGRRGERRRSAGRHRGASGALARPTQMTGSPPRSGRGRPPTDQVQVHRRPRRSPARSRARPSPAAAS